jgi:hypothetical protein
LSFRLRPGVAELAQGPGLDLADALAGDREVLADLLHGVLAAVPQPEAHLDDFLLAGGQGLEQGLRLVLEVDVDHGLRGLRSPPVSSRIQMGLALGPQPIYIDR